jgi:hypothetical protein
MSETDGLDGKARRAAEAVKKILAIAARVAERNRGKPRWPKEGESMRDVAHSGHRWQA